MLHSSESDEEITRIHSMFIEENRVKSFKDWVFDRCECTPKKVEYQSIKVYFRHKAHMTHAHTFLGISSRSRVSCKVKSLKDANAAE